jgi:hypothetical protein
VIDGVGFGQGVACVAATERMMQIASVRVSDWVT